MIRIDTRKSRADAGVPVGEEANPQGGANIRFWQIHKKENVHDIEKSLGSRGLASGGGGRGAPRFASGKCCLILTSGSMISQRGTSTPKNCMKMKVIWPRGGVSLAPRPDPHLIGSATDLTRLN